MEELLGDIMTEKQGDIIIHRGLQFIMTIMEMPILFRQCPVG